MLYSSSLEQTKISWDGGGGEDNSKEINTVKLFLKPDLRFICVAFIIYYLS